MTASSATKKTNSLVSGDSLLKLAFYNAAQANIISIVSNGKIVVANSAACRLLGYSKKELLTKSRKTIFDIKERGFKKMLKERTAGGQSIANVTLIKKTGKSVNCEITSAVFTDDDGIEKSITSIASNTKKIKEQDKIDVQKEKEVAKNINTAIAKQKVIDVKKEKIVADNIVAAQELTEAKQKVIDVRKEKIVADNIVAAQELTETKQKAIDIKKEKIVADNIVAAQELTEAKQKVIDVKKEKIVADNIVAAQALSDSRHEEDSQWVKHISKASYDVMWDWDVLSSQVYIGDSMQEVFGYVLKGNFISFDELKKSLIMGENTQVEENLLKVLASRSNSWNDEYTIKRFDGTVATVISRASIIRDEKGKAIRLIGATQDISRVQELEAKVKEQDAVKKETADVFRMAAMLSYDGIWDWNILTNEYFLGEGFEKLFGSAAVHSASKPFNWGEYLHPGDKEEVEKGIAKALASSATHWEHGYRFIRKDGSVAHVFGRASIIRDAEGTACRMIGVIHDLTRQQEMEKEIVSTHRLLYEYNERFRVLFNSSPDTLYDIDLLADEITLSDGYTKEFGYPIIPHMKPAEVWGKHLHPDDKRAVIEDYNRMLASAETRWTCAYRFLRADGSIANITSSRIIMRDASGKAYRMIGSMQDISQQKGLEEKLEKEIRLKEKQIQDAMMEAKETVRSDIGKELHDNVNQLLSVSRLYLEMAKQGGPQSKARLEQSSEYTMNAIEEIRKLTKGLTTDSIRHLGLKESIINLARDTMEVKNINIVCNLDSFTEYQLNEKWKVNVFRIVQEQLSNILKHAQACNTRIAISQAEGSIWLVIEDDGVGFDTAQKRKGIGLDNINERAKAYAGVAEFVSSPGHGSKVTVNFNAEAAQQRKV